MFSPLVLTVHLLPLDLFFIGNPQTERLNIFGIFFLCSQPYKKSDGNSNRKIQGNETVVQGYTLVHIFIPSIQRNYFTEDVIKERKQKRS